MCNVLRYVFLIFLLFSSRILFAQGEANIWYFGNFLGLDFNSGTPVALNNGQINNNPTEGVATISDANGNLLFYTDGVKIWNRLHQLMPNGTGLFGNLSSSQSAVIVPKINDNTRYYVFTIDQLNGPKGLCYSVVNMTLDNGKGDIEVKNVPVITGVVEKITAVRHCNNRDVWVLTHGAESNIYYAFLVSPTGINITPVISHTGSVLWGVLPGSPYDSTTLGYMKASPDGKKIAAAHWTVNVDVSDFNNATGIVSNSYGLHVPSDPHYLSYGVEFSPDSRLVYATVFYTDPVNAQKKNALFQYDVSLASPAAVRASKQVISQNSDPIQSYAALQQATDGKIYMAKNTYKHIAAVSNPNVYGPACGFINNAIAWTLPQQACSFGLPTFIQSYFYPLDSFTYVVNCPGLNVNFNYTPGPDVLSVLWKFGDPASGVNNTSSLNNPVHTFSANGTYNVELIKFTNCGTDTLRRQVSTSGIDLNLGADTLVCGGINVLLNSSSAGSGNTFLWQDGSTNPTFTATTAGLYWCQVTNTMGCIARDSLNVSFKPIPVYSLGNDTAICQGNSITLNATVTNATSYSWNTLATTPTISTTLAGIYWCDVNKEGCVFRDSLTLTMAPSPLVNLGADISMCGTTPIVLDATYPNCTYLWQNGSIDPTLTTTTSGLYWVQVTSNNGCAKRDSINIAFNSMPVFSLGADTAICSGDILILNATVPTAVSYLWNTGAVTPTINAFLPGIYWCEVNNGCVYRDTLVITAVLPKPVINLGNDTTACGNGPIILNAINTNASYLWQNNSTNPTISATTTGIYWVQVTSNNGCTKRDSINIIFDPIPVFNLGPDTDICQNDLLTLNATVNNANSYQWNTGAITAAIDVSQPGIYWCQVTKQNCVFRDSLVVLSIKPLPVVNLGNDQTLCEGLTTSLDATYSNSSYLWQDGTTNPVLIVTQQGTYIVEVNYNGCKKSDTVIVNYNLKPRFTLGQDQAICPGNTIQLNPQLNSLWQLRWQDGTTNPTYTVTQPGTYSLSAANNCGTTQDDIVVSKGICKVYVPTAFTPNNDGLNDIFRVSGTEVITDFDLKIFNRWGEIIFETTDKMKGWDGKLKGKMLTTGTFVYLLKYKELNAVKPAMQKGTFILIR